MTELPEDHNLAEELRVWSAELFQGMFRKQEQFHLWTYLKEVKKGILFVPILK